MTFYFIMNFFGERESLREYQWHTRLTYAIGQQYDLLIENHWTLLIWLFTQIAVFAVVYLAYRIVLVFGRQDNKDKTIEVKEVSLERGYFSSCMQGRVNSIEGQRS